MKIIYAFLICLVSSSIFGQITNNQKPFIEVTGKSEQYVSPNEVHIDLCIEERMQGDHKITLTTLESNLKRELKNVGIAESNLYISDINSVVSKTGWFSQETLSTGSYSLKVTEVAKIKDVFEIFKKLDILDTQITKATHSNLVTLQKENRIKAIKAAKNKADYLLNAIGSKTGKPLKVIEEANNNQAFANLNYISRQNYSRNSISKLKSEADNNVQFESIKISSTIHVIFEIQ